jgi:hypothetical protein
MMSLHCQMLPEAWEVYRNYLTMLCNTAQVSSSALDIVTLMRLIVATNKSILRGKQTNAIVAREGVSCVTALQLGSEKHTL